MNPLAFLVALLPAAAPLSAQEAERARVTEILSPSVVAVRNEEGYGSGMILDEKGLILTNAHVILSPLPCWIEVQGAGSRELVWFRRVTLVGVHPTHDMALLRIDPAENRVRLTPVKIATSRSVTGETLYAMGYPSTYSGTRKILSPGTLRSVDATMLHTPGLQEAAMTIVPGNSGGPLCNIRGEAIGIVTIGGFDQRGNHGGAIPLYDFKADSFVPLSRRASNPGHAAAFLDGAEKILRMGGEPRGLQAQYAESLYDHALLEDFSNPEIYYKLGLLKRTLGHPKSATAYLIRSLRLRPWPDSGARCYHELGASLLGLSKKTDAIAVWREGIAKYPDSCPLMWEALAQYQFDAGEYLEAAVSSRWAGKVFGGKGAEMNRIYRESRTRLSSEEQLRLQGREREIDGELLKMKSAAEEAQKGGKAFLTTACASIVKEFEGAQKEVLFSPSAETAPTTTKEEYATRIVRSLIKAGKAHLSGGDPDKAISFFEEAVRDYPSHPETAEARLYLEALKKK